MSSPETRENQVQYTPVVMEPSWLEHNGGNLAGLAQELLVDLSKANYNRRDIHEKMLMFSDELEAAGCADQRILSHIRHDHIHTQDCWVLSLFAYTKPEPQIQGQELQPLSEQQEILSQINQNLQLYATRFNREPNLSELELPERTEEEREKFTRLILVDAGMTPQQVFQAFNIEPAIPINQYPPATNLDQLASGNSLSLDQTSNSKPYAVFAEPDREVPATYRDQSFNQLEAANQALIQEGKPPLQFMNFTQRLLLELLCDQESRRKNKNAPFLDRQSVTLTSSRVPTSSLHPAGYVLYVYSYSREVCVSWYHPGCHAADFGARRVVSLPAAPSEAQAEQA